MNKIFLFSFIVAFVSCNSNQREEDATLKMPRTPDSMLPKHVDTLPKNSNLETAVNLQHGNEINISFPPGSSSIWVKCHLDSVGATVICYVSITNEKKLLAKIKTVKMPANIRFSHLVSPDKKSDGPFGQELDYDLSQKGIYKLVIGSSLMAENPYTGEFGLLVIAR